MRERVKTKVNELIKGKFSVALSHYSFRVLRVLFSHVKNFQKSFRVRLWGEGNLGECSKFEIRDGKRLFFRKLF